MGVISFFFFRLLSRSLCVDFSDTSGPEEYVSMLESYCSTADIVFVCLNLTERKAFEDMELRLNVARRHCKTVFAVGTMMDRVNDRKISKEEARAHFERMDPPVPFYCEVSSKTGEGVQELFENAVREWVLSHNDYREKTEKTCIIS